ncbi:MAG: hypothetical protein BGP04_24050 [Rhizobiales bacterium 62-17]|nr:hypothetical protein [Hyphomicrobiales bacterium]OJY00613.1 MAG: hypothetical protein BGP04_24050 [Rhizobiales bacterium 62-17]
MSFISEWIESGEGYLREEKCDGETMLVRHTSTGTEHSRVALDGNLVAEIVDRQRRGMIVRRYQPGILDTAIYDLAGAVSEREEGRSQPTG